MSLEKYSKNPRQKVASMKFLSVQTHSARRHQSFATSVSSVGAPVQSLKTRCNYYVHFFLSHSSLTRFLLKPNNTKINIL